MCSNQVLTLTLYSFMQMMAQQRPKSASTVGAKPNQVFSFSSRSSSLRVSALHSTGTLRQGVFNRLPARAKGRVSHAGAVAAPHGVGALLESIACNTLASQMWPESVGDLGRSPSSIKSPAVGVF